ncbi:Trafficking protein particle complex subunit 8 [Phytophthora nicotianae]|uniref:Trafficking protein particle complex subunit 8 n=1 Tax=Phytophthora nicotianae TaxID=4792 RepID=A0A0W8D5H7_PHYNI|nr:Trafficking protein particle complex subunit 8 [Phytophthora nicotianae]
MVKHALIVGASSGIGLAVAHKVAPMVDKLTLCSRRCPPDLVASIRAKNPSLDVVYERLDVSLLHEVRKFTTRHKDTKFDWIVLTAGILSLNGRTETQEGLDVKMSTHYYGRDLMAQALSEHAPNVSFMHLYPGFVNTGLFDRFPWYVRVPSKIFAVIAAHSPERCAEYLVATLTKPEFAAGWKLLGERGEPLAKTKYHTDKLKNIVWEHTLKTIDSVMKQ